MILQNVVVEDFRAFRHAEIELPETGLVLIAGANNTGKTALLSAFDVVAGDSGDITSLRHAGGAGPARVMARFGLSEAERTGLLAAHPRGDQLLADGAIASLEFLFAEHEDLRVQGLIGLGLSEIRTVWPRYGTQTLVRLDAPPEPGASPILNVMSALTRDVDPTGMTGGGFLGQIRWLDELLRIRPELQFLGQLLPTWRSRFYHFVL